MTTADVRSRILHSLVPFNPKLHDISENNPDLYGPFWIYTTVIFVIAASGSLSIYMNKILKTSSFFQEFLPVAAATVYIILKRFMDSDLVYQ